MKGFLWIARELQNAAQQEVESEAERLTQQLRSLYMQLEAGDITDEEFDEAEERILARLDELNGAGTPDDEDDDDEDDDDEEEDGGDEDGLDTGDDGEETETERESESA